MKNAIFVLGIFNLGKLNNVEEIPGKSIREILAIQGDQYCLSIFNKPILARGTL